MYPAIGSIVAKHARAEPPGDAALRGVPDLADPHRLRRRISASGTTRSSPTEATRLPIYTNVGEDTGRTTGADFFRLPTGLTPRAAARTAGRCWRTSTGCAASSTARRSIEAMDQLRAAGGRAAGRPPGAGGLRPVAGAGGDPRPLRQAPLVPAGAAGPPAGRGGGRVRDDRPELPPGLGHLGQPRRQHPALRRHQQGPEAAAAALRPPDHHAGLATWTSAACSTTCSCWPWASSAGRR